VDGVVVVRGWAVDGAGNRDAAGANVSWVWDTSPPETLAVVVDTSNASVSTAWLRWANATALNSTVVSLMVLSSELAPRFVVDVDGDGVGVVTMSPRWSNGSWSMLQVVGASSMVCTAYMSLLWTSLATWMQRLRA
jgi:hypothetical protein